MPSSKKEVEKFLGFVNYYRKCIKDCAKQTAPLYDLLRKDAPSEWSEKYEEQFQCLKEILNYGLGFVLGQDHEGERKVVDWWSRKLSESEKKHGITEKEFLAIAEGIKHFDYYLRGTPFKVISDHSALKFIKSKDNF